MPLPEFFTDSERSTLRELYGNLLQSSSSVISERDGNLLQSHIRHAVEAGGIERDGFGFNPIVTDWQTALLIATEISPNRNALIAVALSTCVYTHENMLADIARDFGTDVASIMRGLLRVRGLYAKSATIETDNFRSLLVTLAEDMRDILNNNANCFCFICF